MKEHGILFQDEMVRAILDGRKDVTRRASDVWAKRKPGDRLWVREAWWHEPPRWTPSIHMPRWASRLTLEVVSIDVEPGVEVDIKAHGPEWVETVTPLPRITDEEARREGVADRAAYLDLWRSINGDEFKDYLWRIEFRVVERA